MNNNKKCSTNYTKPTDKQTRNQRNSKYRKEKVMQTGPTDGERAD